MRIAVPNLNSRQPACLYFIVESPAAEIEQFREFWNRPGFLPCPEYFQDVQGYYKFRFQAFIGFLCLLRVSWAGMIIKPHC